MSKYGVTHKKLKHGKSIHLQKVNETIYGKKKAEKPKLVLKPKKDRLGIPSDTAVAPPIKGVDNDSTLSISSGFDNPTADSPSNFDSNGDLAAAESGSRGTMVEHSPAVAGGDKELPPETDALALNKSGNARGMHLTPERAMEIRSKRRFYGKHVPPLQCNVCNYTSVCPFYKAGYECQFEKVINHRITDPASINALMVKLAESDLRRAQLGIIFEQLSGGSIDGKVSDRIDAAFHKLEMLKTHLIGSSATTTSDEIHMKGSIVKGLMEKLLADEPKPIEVEVRSGQEAQFVENQCKNDSEYEGKSVLETS